jgi:hypothetical protein
MNGGGFFQLVCMVTFPTLILAAGPLVSVEIISVGNFYPNSISSFPYIGPAINLALTELTAHFNDSVTFKQTFLYDLQYKFCDELTANVVRLTAEYYYQRLIQPNLTVFIAAGKSKSARFGIRILLSATFENFQTSY